MTAIEELEKPALERLREGRSQIMSQVRRRIVGQDDVIEQVLIALFSGGHCLLTGVPGLAKTLLIKSLGELLDLSYRRIQFRRISCQRILQEWTCWMRIAPPDDERLSLLKDQSLPILSLQTRSTRTPPKTQAALLEAMQEYQVTAAGERYTLEKPFFVLATQNPIELEGTYPLPEAQLDRFMFNIVIDYLSAEDELQVALETTTREQASLDTVLSGTDILSFQSEIRKVFVPKNVAQFAVDLVRSTRPGRNGTLEFVSNWVSWGAGLRATQYLLLGGKVRAALRGRYNVAIEDIHALAYPVLRHRVLTNFYAESEGITVERVIDQLLNDVPEPKSGLS